MPVYNFINSLFKINLAMLVKFAIHYGLKAKNLIDDSVEFVLIFRQNVFTSAVWSSARKDFSTYSQLTSISGGLLPHP